MQEHFRHVKRSTSEESQSYVEEEDTTLMTVKRSTSEESQSYVEEEDTTLTTVKRSTSEESQSYVEEEDTTLSTVLKRSTSEELQSYVEEEDTTLTTEKTADFKTSEEFLEVNKHSRQPITAERFRVAEHKHKTSTEQNQQEGNYSSSHASTTETNIPSDRNESIQSSTEPWYFQEMTVLQREPRYSERMSAQQKSKWLQNEVGVVNVTDENSRYHLGFGECSARKRMDIVGDKGTVILDITQPKKTGARRCSIKFTVPKGKIVSVWIQHLRNYRTRNNLYIHRYEKEECFMFGIFKCPKFSHVFNQKRYYSTRKFLQYTFTHTGKNMVRVSLHFESHEKRPEMEVSANTSTSGIITSPMYDGVSLMPTGNIGHNVSLTVQPGYVVMISVQHFDVLDADIIDFCLCLKKLGYKEKQVAPASADVHICVADGTNIELIDSSFTVEFLPELTVHETRGFKLFYSLHTEDEQPVRLQSGLFNCTSPLYNTFKQHLECNFVTECQDGEDERDCPHTTASCREGIPFRNNCYSYFFFPNKVSWMQASSLCRRANSRLAAFHNSSDLDAFANILNSKYTVSMLWIGLQVSGSRFGTAYKRILRWTNNRSSFDFLANSTMSTFPSCALMRTSLSGVQITVNMKLCNTPNTSHVLCENMNLLQSSHKTDSVLFPVVQIQSQNWSQVNAPITRCSDQFFVLDFLSCSSPCHGSSASNAPFCALPSGGVMPMFRCDNSDQTIPFTLVCDRQSDCLDNSDESFCHYQECRAFACNNGKCIAQQLRCNKLDNCDDGSDEIQCYDSIISGHDQLLRVPPLSLIELDGSGSFRYSPWNESQSCPETHFRCPQSHCLPVYLHCNGVEDCPWGEDEEYCRGYDTRPGFYHCYLSRIFLHPEHLCDGVAQCPHHDDEKYCGLRCPSQCWCLGLSFVCSQPISAKDYPDLRYLDASGTSMTLWDLHSSYYLVSLKLSDCGLTELEKIRLSNLRELDLSNNSLHVLDMNSFMNLPNLRALYLSWNPIVNILASTAEQPHLSMNSIHLSGLMFHSFHSSQSLFGFPNTEIVNISHSKIEEIGSFKNLSKLKVLDMSQSPVTTFPAGVFTGLTNLKHVYTMNYKLCCPAVLPSSFPQSNCIAPEDDISSCDCLLRLPEFRIFLWIFAVVAIVGNSVSFVVRQFLQKKAARTGFPVFVTNLCVADLLMGVYLAIIGIADYFYRGSYLWYDQDWKNSWACRIAGFLSLLSSEVSAFIICLITLDRFIVMRFPFTQRRFQRRSATVAAGLAWFTGAIIAALPLTPVAAHWDFYGQTGICIPLPFTTYTFPGEKYAFGIMIVLNFVLFMMIAAGQVAIFCSVRSNSKATAYLKTKSRDLTIAHRLAFIVLSDFCCWFPIGLLGLLASQNVPIPDEVNVGMAIFVLPLNSALNPFLYTFNAMMERRRENEKRKLMEFLENRIRSEVLAEKTNKRQPHTASSPPPATLMIQILDKVRKGQLSHDEADLVYNTARELVSERKTRIH